MYGSPEISVGPLIGILCSIFEKRFLGKLQQKSEKLKM
jgi:hypothetical protein